MLTFEQMKFLVSPEGRAAMELDVPADPLAAQKFLRKRFDVAQAAAIGDLVKVRSKAGAKFPAEFASQVIGSDVMIQQASSLRLGCYVGKRLADAAGADEVYDICSGLGGDAIGIAIGGAKVCGVDASEAAVLAGENNAAALGVGERCRFVCARAEDMLEEIAGKIVHVDPDRRATGRRTAELEDYAPGVETLEAIIRGSAGGSIKLSPATDCEQLSDLPGVKIEYICEDWVCKQLVLWWGKPAEDLPSDFASVVWGDWRKPEFEIIEATGATADVDEIGEWLYEVAPSVSAADAVDDLAEELDAWRVYSQIDWLSGDEPAETKLARSFKVLKVVSGREKDVKKAIAELDGGQVAIKPRGVNLKTDSLQKKLRKPGGANRLAVFWGRFGKSQKAIITEDNLKQQTEK